MGLHPRRLWQLVAAVGIVCAAAVGCGTAGLSTAMTSTSSGGVGAASSSPGLFQSPTTASSPAGMTAPTLSRSVSSILQDSPPVTSAVGSVRPRPGVQGFLAAWDRVLQQAGPTAIILTSDSDGQIGDWQGQQSGNFKIAFLTGAVRAAPDVAATPVPSEQPVSWRNGTRHLTPVISAATAVDTFTRSPQISGSCQGCVPIVLSQPRLIRESASTATGPATVPVWSFAVAGSNVRVTMVAVIPDAQVRSVPGLPPGQIWDYSETVALAADGSLIVSLGAAPDGACGGLYVGSASESALAIAVVVGFLPTSPSPTLGQTIPMQSGGGCPPVAAERTVRIPLSRPLGGRVVIDGDSGMVLPLK